MSRSTLPFTLGLAALALATPLLAQEAEDEAPPTMLVVSQWICPNAELENISDMYEQYTLPVEQEMVAEGKMMSAGLFFHAWADEWNVGYFRVIPSLAVLTDVLAEVNERVEANNPGAADQPSPFAVCSAHKDNIYFMGPGTGPDEDDG